MSALLSNALADAIALVASNASIACYPLIGRGDKHAADEAAVQSMRQSFNDVAIKGRIVIGEGEMDEAPMLYIGESVGNGHGTEVDIAVDPLEGTSLAAHDGIGSVCTLAVAPRGSMLHAPDIYMQKLAAAPWVPNNILDINMPVDELMRLAAKSGNRKTSDLTVTVLDRPRHADIIKKLRSVGVRVKLLSDGDVNGVLATSFAGGNVDFYVGSGGAPEGVLAAAALRVLGGKMRGKLLFENDEQKQRAISMGVVPDSILTETDMIKSDVIFASSGVTDGFPLRGVKKINNGFVTDTLVLSLINNVVNIKRIDSILLCNTK